LKNPAAPAVKREAEEDWGKGGGGDRRFNVNGFTCRHEGRRHAHFAPRRGSTHGRTALAPGAQASTMPRRLYAERRLLHAAVSQCAAVDRKAWVLTTKPADSENRLPAISIPATLPLPDLRVEIDLRSEAIAHSLLP
jgi:hypothetical protein